MNYYKRHIGDYHKKAGRLSLLQHGVYTVLMDAIYDREKFPTKDEALDWCWASTPEEVAAVELILAKFFTNGNGIYKQKRVQEELNAYRSRSEINQRIAIERETNRAIKHTKRGDSSPNHKPLTINHKPLKDISPNGDKGKPKVSPPFALIVEKWNEFAENHGLPKTVKQTTVIKGQIRQRWLQDMPSIDQWDNFFDYIGQSYFLTGRTNGSGERPPFRCTLQWATKETNFAKIAAGEYHRV